MEIVFLFLLQEDNAILLHSKSLKEFLFHNLSYVLQHKQDIFSIKNILLQHTKYWKQLLGYFPQLFPIIFSWWVIYSFPVIFIYKRLKFLLFFHSIFVILSGCPQIFSWFNATIFFIDGIYCCFFVFIQSRESTYDPFRFGFYFTTLIIK